MGLFWAPPQKTPFWQAPDVPVAVIKNLPPLASRGSFDFLLPSPLAGEGPGVRGPQLRRQRRAVFDNRDRPNSSCQKPNTQKISPRNFRSQLKLQQTGKQIFLNSQRLAILGLCKRCVTRGTRAGEWKVLRSRVESRKFAIPLSLGRKPASRPRHITSPIEAKHATACTPRPQPLVDRLSQNGGSRAVLNANFCHQVTNRPRNAADNCLLVFLRVFVPLW